MFTSYCRVAVKENYSIRFASKSLDFFFFFNRIKQKKTNNYITIDRILFFRSVCDDDILMPLKIVSIRRYFVLFFILSRALRLQCYRARQITLNHRIDPIGCACSTCRYVTSVPTRVTRTDGNGGG